MSSCSVSALASLSNGSDPGLAPLRLRKVEGDVVDPSTQPGMVNPPHLSEEPEHLLVFGQNDEREALDSVLACGAREDCQQGSPQTPTLELVNHRDGHLGDVCVRHPVISRDAQDAFFACRLVRSRDQCESVLVIDNRQPVRQCIRQPLQR